MQPLPDSDPTHLTDVATTAVATERSASAVVPSTESGCPPPLEWQEVLREFHKQADAWYLDRGTYRISGRTIGSGPPLYLLNGFSGTHELNALLVWLLRDRYRCLLFDYSIPAARAKVTPGDLADDLMAVADTCGDGTFDIFAPSFGGLVALEAMRRHSGRIGHAILLGGFVHRTLSRFERSLIHACALHPGRLRHLPLRKFIQRQSQRRWFPPFDRTRWQFLVDNTGAAPLADLARRAAIIRDCDLRSVLNEVRQPVLLVQTEGDGRILEGCGKVLASGLPNSRVEWMNDTGQFAYLTHPHRLAKVIHGFLEGPPS